MVKIKSLQIIPEDQTSAVSPVTLTTLPRELLSSEHCDSIGRYLSLQALYRLTLTSSELSFFGDEIKKKLAQNLLEHVLKGEFDQAKKLISINPKFLLIKTTAVDYSDRKFENITPFQAALYANDVLMWKMIEEIGFKRLSDGDEEKTKQVNEIFPEGLPIEQQSYDFSEIVKVITESSAQDIAATLKSEQNNTLICQVFNQFRVQFTVLSMQEKYFNPQHFLSALDIYDRQFDHWNEHQQNLFWCQVIGFIQRFLPAYYAQILCQDVYHVLKEKIPFEHTLIFQTEKEKLKSDAGKFFPLTSTFPMLGKDYAVCSGTRAKRKEPGVGRGRFLLLHRLRKHIAQNQEHLNKLYRECRSEYQLRK